MPCARRHVFVLDRPTALYTSRSELQRRTRWLIERLSQATSATRAVLVAVDTDEPQRPIEPELVEFEALAEAAGARIVDRVVQRRDRVDPATLVGSGKAQRDRGARSNELERTSSRCFNDLRPRQRKNLGEGRSAADRRPHDAHSRRLRAPRAQPRGQLQVELAQLRYRQSNLIGIGADLSRLGGGIGTRGPGETKLEVDRRRIQERITVLTGAARGGAAAARNAALGPQASRSSRWSDIRMSGSRRCSTCSGAATRFVADQPFATLDPTTRRVYLAPGRYVRFADTVGFITDLPQDLVNAFRATLEELRDADLLVHVLDASNPDWPRQRARSRRSCTSSNSTARRA